MFRSRSTLVRRAAVVAVFALAATALGAATSAPAKPAATEVSTHAQTVLQTRTATQPVGPVQASVVASAPAIVVGSPFGFTVSTSSSQTVDSISVRLRVKYPDGRLIFQRTRTATKVPKGSATYPFERATADIGLPAGPYITEFEIVTRDGGVETGRTLSSTLYIYDPKLGPVPVVLAARISGQPLSDPTGRFIADPAQFTRARNDASRIASWVLAQPDRRVTLAVSPMLLSEWRRIAEGYELASPEGVEVVPATAPIATEYAATLNLLSTAEQTGRLELVSMGYADPDLSELSARMLSEDVTPQYAEGLSAVFASLESTPSTGTLPAGQCLPPSAVKRLVEQDVLYAVVRSVCVRAGEATANPGVYRVRGSKFAVVIADDRGAKAIAEANPRAFTDVAFERQLSASPTRPFTTLVDLGAGGSDVEAFLACAEEAARQPWARTALAREIATNTERGSVRLIGSPADRRTPAGFWGDVRSARSWADALMSAMGGRGARPATAQRNSLIAECSAWAGPQGDWALATRGLIFADTAERIARSMLEPVSLSVAPVRLSGTSGEVPVTIKNGGQASLKVLLKAIPGNGVRLAGTEEVMEITLRPQDNFFEIPVELQNILSGKLAITVSAGDVVLDESVVTVRASYLDRLAVIAGVVLLLGILLAYIIRRVRRAEARSGESIDSSQYTETGTETDSRRES